ncbi:MAG TPA: tetratricopeptide repeat protein [Thermoanaerobaculia bacterium]|nr:tetratricopeptide repeat protein [Thermoanaerobaculia bacterium]
MRRLAGLLLFAALLLPAGLAADATRDSRKAYLRARAAVADGRYRDALEQYRHVIAILPEDAVVRYEYAQLLRDLNVADEARKQASEAVRLDPNLPEARRLLGTLEMAAADQDPSALDRAIEQLRAARRLSPYDTSSAVSLARALMARGRAVEASRLLDELPEVRTQPGLTRLAAQARTKAGRLKEAESLYQMLREADPNDREVLAALIDIYEEQDKIDKALDLLADLQKRDPENAGIAERITLDLARAGRFDEAEKRARELATSRPENRDIRRLMASVLFERGDVAGGENILRGLIATDADDELSRRSLAGEMTRERRFSEAKPLLQESVRRGADDPKRREARQAAMVELGYLAFLQKDYASARLQLAPLALSGSAVNDRAMRILLGAARDSEDFAFGLDRAAAAAAAEPRNPEWPAAAAEFRWRTGDHAKAGQELEKLAASEDADEALAASDAWSRLKEYAAAARVAREVVRKYPENTEALFRLAASLERAGDVAESEKSFTRLLETRPADAQTLNYLGYMWADKNVHLEKAREMLERAVARDPRNGAYQDSLGWVYFRLGRIDLAEKHLKVAAEREPDDSTIHEHLGDLAEKQGSLAKAISEWEKSLRFKPDEPEKIRAKLKKAQGK